MIAAVWRPAPTGRKLRAIDCIASSRNSCSSKPGPLISRNVSIASSIAVSSVVGLRRANLRMIRSVGCPTLRSPVLDMIDVMLRTRSGCSIAIVCTIIPPIDTPTTWALSIPSASSNPTASAAMSLSTYCDAIGRRNRTDLAMCQLVGGGPVNSVDRPLSRLSSRITRNPWSAIRSTNSWGQSVSWPPSPITSNSGSPEPCCSYSIVIPFACTEAMSPGYAASTAAVHPCRMGVRALISMRPPSGTVSPALWDCSRSDPTTHPKPSGSSSRSRRWRPGSTPPTPTRTNSVSRSPGSPNGSTPRPPGRRSRRHRLPRPCTPTSSAPSCRG